ncbi:Protein of unknown function [Chryseobacterium piscicola]|jgi:hypothetical protein|uniref:DUF1573 domain-containing protein n=1 Tax=Chryseobacterium piscicola TaxID=551459 RepID=A0A1N7NAD1_9FLAO|nr:DUF1573 domain-containing protein [Chryseobacterium piscicola]PQA92235.1 hypothetical protein B0A70_11480 [Chryseobacterium piscicola]SIS95353.1 Protein of unknown function [Chryseobacterium piscicola]
MKKTVSIIALSVIGLGLVSCKKETKETPTALNTNADSTVAPAQDSIAPMVSGESTPATASSSPITTIALSESNFDFGKIKKGDKVSHVYEITNMGKNPLVISEVKPGCGCTAPEFTKEPILPGKKGKITLSFDSSTFDGAVQKFADVYANVEKAPIKLTFNANIEPK